MNVLQIKPVRSDTQEHQALLEAAAALEQTRYVLAREEPIRESILLGAFIQGQWVGFLRFVVQVIGSDAGRPPIELAGKPLLELRGGLWGLAGVPSAKNRPAHAGGSHLHL